MLFQILAALPLLSTVGASPVQSAVEWKEQNTWDRLGNLSPYHVAPAVRGVSADLPEDCTVNQVMLVRIFIYLMFDLELDTYNLA